MVVMPGKSKEKVKLWLPLNVLAKEFVSTAIRPIECIERLLLARPITHSLC